MLVCCQYNLPLSDGNKSWTVQCRAVTNITSEEGVREGHVEEEEEERGKNRQSWLKTNLKSQIEAKYKFIKAPILLQTYFSNSFYSIAFLVRNKYFFFFFEL